jgi:hypothetical protein
MAKLVELQRSEARGGVAKGDLRYELKSVKAMRGTEGRSIAKWQAQGWELVSQDSAKIHTTLNFRKVKPPLPMRQIVMGAAVAAVLLGILGVGAALEGNGGSEDAASRKATPSAVATTAPEVTPTPKVTPSVATPSQPEATQPGTTASQPVEPPDGPLTNSTVYALLDRLNAPSTSGIKVGDRFRITGELMEPDLWFVGRTGDYSVMLKAQGGRQDLPVFVDRSLTTGWGDGTRVEMVVKNVLRTINGETTDGWLLVKSVKTL